MRARVCLLLAPLVAVPLALAATPGTATASPRAVATTAAIRGGTVRVGVLALPDGLNPNTVDDSGQATLDATEAVLPSVFKAGTLTPQLNNAIFSSATVTKVRPFTVTYVIKSNAVWSDGVPVGFSDFNLAWHAQNGTSEDTHPVSTDGYADITSVTGAATRAGRVVTAVFAKPYAEWKSLFSSLLPAHVTDLTAWDDAVSAEFPPLSAGPYTFASTQPAGSLVLVRNPRYIGTPATVGSIVFKTYGSTGALASAMKSGAIQLVTPSTNPEDVLPLKHVGGINLETTQSLFYEHLDLNADDPVAGDITVRHAIGLAFSADDVATAGKSSYQGLPVAVDGARLLLSGQRGYTDGRVLQGHGDTIGAAAVMSAAGWVEGPDGIFAKDGVRASIVVKTTSGNALRRAEMNVLVAKLKLAGIELVPEYDGATALFAALPKHHFQATLFGWLGGTAPITALAPTLRTNGSANYDSYSDPRVDTLVAKAQNSSNDDAERAAIKAADGLLWLDDVTFPLVVRPAVVAVSKHLHGVRPSPTLDGIFANAGSWRLDPS